MLFLKILGGLLALALGVWLGMPGRYNQSQADIDRALGRKGRGHQKVKRHFTPLDWFRNEARGSERRARGRRRFTTATPKSPQKPDGEKSEEEE